MPSILAVNSFLENLEMLGNLALFVVGIPLLVGLAIRVFDWL